MRQLFNKRSLVVLCYSLIHSASVVTADTYSSVNPSDPTNSKVIIVNNYYGVYPPGKGVGGGSAWSAGGSSDGGGTSGGSSTVIGGYGAHAGGSSSSGYGSDRSDRGQVILMDNWTAWCYTTLGMINATSVRLKDICLLGCRTTPNCGFVVFDKVIQVCMLIAKDAVCTVSRNPTYMLIAESQKQFQKKDDWGTLGFDLMFNANYMLDINAAGSNKQTCVDLCHVVPKCNALSVTFDWCYLKNVPPQNRTGIPRSQLPYPNSNWTNYFQVNDY